MLAVWVLYYGALLFVLWGYALAVFFRSGGMVPQEASLMALLAMGFFGFSFYWIVDKRGVVGALRRLGPGRLLYVPLGLALGLVLGALARLVPLLWGAAGFKEAPVNWSEAGPALVIALILVFVVGTVMELGARSWPLEDMVELMGPRRANLLQAALWPVLLVPYALEGGWSLLPGFILVGYGYSLVAGWLFLRSRGVWAPGALFAGVLVADGAVSLFVEGNPLWCGASSLTMGLAAVALGLALTLSYPEGR